MLLSALARSGSRPMLIVGDSRDDAGYLYHDLVRLLGEESVLVLPSAYRRDIKYGQIDPSSDVARTEALSSWNVEEKLKVVVTYPEALAEVVATTEDIAGSSRVLKVGGTIDLIELEKWLRGNDFKQVDYVYEPGQFAVRGSIVDIFSYSYELPYRLDFFGDEIDSIRTFNVDTQLSAERKEQVSIIANMAGKTGNGGVSLLEFIDPETVIAMRDAAYTVERIKNIVDSGFSRSAALADEGDSEAMRKLVDPEKFSAMLERFRQIHFTSANSRPDGCSQAVDFGCTPQGLYHKNFDIISESFRKFLADGYSLYILSDSAKQIERLRQIFADRNDEISFTPVITTLHEGFVDSAEKICVFTDHQIFDRFHKYNFKSDRARSGKVALSLKELGAISPGDYIVHVDHGVGKFAGMVRSNVNGHRQEMIKLVYQNDDIILVSVHSLHKLAKYRGKEGVPPKINKLGSGAWNKVKERTKSHLKDIARDLIKLYSERKNKQGFCYSPDTYLQQELEASFKYEDTPDQLSATQAVKADMESDRPMDRLICGDVGFGKTEIAIRAAFKAATDGKQTAILVPTTVLAYQHFNTFKSRLKDFPVRVDYLSRARTTKQVKEILKELEAGKIDIIIGTHKLIGKEVKFKDLGLLIIDEEQKFGVAVKEKLKQMKVNVDTLTMSATPIPRTLQFSLMGARDLSNILTPPPNRFPIITTVCTLTDEVLSEAVNFELSRNGQVFIVNPRIEGLYDLQAMLRRVVPDARTVVAHGQMPPAELEQIIIDFANHDYDVLIATTIIESGIDMPNVNTMMVNDAHKFGLSELHQLRGRVGRSSRKAFCYLFVPPHLPLTPVARRRLQAIESFSELGSGIHIAMQDLDIRGAGNLLGAEQSGFIADLGYETYQKILKEAVMELRNEEFADLQTAEDAEEPTEYVTDCLVESDMELLLPATYVPTESERIALYQELDSIDRELDLQQFRLRMEDRFGKIPPETLELMRVPRLRRLARQLGIEKVNLKGGKMYIYFVGDENKAYYQSPMFGKLLHYLQDNPRRVNIREVNGKRSFLISSVDTVEEAVDILNQVHQLSSI
ncbi:MAG: transcription-repair coupling factor [Muribaculaceae bacterium]|nr:transcription-repair coupling factor [Muribaculaceae bacterium]